MYFTDRNTNRKATSWSGSDFDRFAKAEQPFNQIYDEAYISVFQFDDIKYFAEHNVPLSKAEIDGIISYVSTALSKINHSISE